MARLLNYTEKQKAKMDKIASAGKAYKIQIDAIEKKPYLSYEDHVKLKKLRCKLRDNSEEFEEVAEAQIRYADILKEISKLSKIALKMREEYGF